MALLLETTLGDLVIDLDIEGSPELCKNVLKLTKARYYTSNLIYNVQINRFCQLGDPQGDGSGGACIYGLISSLSDDGILQNERVLKSRQRFLKSNMGRALTADECQEKGRVVATEMKGISDTIGSQLLITTCSGKDMALDGFKTNENGDDRQSFRSVGIITEDDNNVLDQIASAYCDADGRPYADIRIIRAHVVDDPFDDPPGMDVLLKARGVKIDDENNVTMSPEYERPSEEQIEIRIQADQIDSLTGEEDLEKIREQEEELLRREDKSRAVVLEMLGDLPDADMTAPENVLFVCKLNPVTEDDDLELIFSRFDEKVKAEIIRDQDTGASLQYAFVEFSSKQQAAEAYFKMNNALVDDRRIKVDFSQSVAKVWNKFSQRMRNSSGQRSNRDMPRDPFLGGSQRPVGSSGSSGRGDRRPRDGHNNRNNDSWRNRPADHRRYNDNRSHDDSRSFHNDRNVPRHHEDDLDDFGRRRPPQQRPSTHSNDNRGGWEHARPKERDTGDKQRDVGYRERDSRDKEHDGRNKKRDARDKERDESYKGRDSRDTERDRRDKDRRDRERDDRHRQHDTDRRRRRSRESDSDDSHASRDGRKRERSRSRDRDRKSRKRNDEHRKRHRHDSSDESRASDTDRHSRRKSDGHRHERHREKHERSRDEAKDRDRKGHRSSRRSDDSRHEHRDEGRRRSENK